MATKHDEYKVYYFSFDEDELFTIVAALINSGEHALATEISDAADIWPEEECECALDATYKDIGATIEDILFPKFRVK